MASDASQHKLSKAQVTLRILVIIFLVELVVMLLLTTAEIDLSPLVESLLDSFLLATLSMPLLYVGVIYPFVQARDNAEQQLEQSKARLLEAQHLAHCGNWELDITQGVANWSDEIHHIVGSDPSQVVGPAVLKTIVDPKDWPTVETSLNDAIKEGKTHELEYQITDFNGNRHWLYCKAEPEFDNQGKTAKLVGIAQDITKHKETELLLQRQQLQLIEAKEIAEAASRAKDDFLARMSHELRTPLTSIIGNSEHLAEQALSPEHKSMVQAIEAAGRSQLALVNDVLDMSKIESGKFTIDENPYNLSYLLNNVERMLTIRAQTVGLELVIEQKNDEDHLLLGDEKRIEQILINLIGNAIKFTPEGTVTLTTLKEGSDLIFKVEDTGVGMTQEVLDRLFLRFEQADGSISRRFGGSGLGLFISLNLAEMMAGTIDVSSQEGGGSVFELILPYQRSDLLVKPEQRENSNRSTEKEKLSGHVLIAEDTPELQLLERRILEGMGLTVTTASNGREAVDLASTQTFDLILMDMQMPEIDGIEATELLRSQGNPVPIVALTANVMQKHQQLFAEAGCNGFLAKPIDKQKLRAVLKQHL